LKRLMHKMIVIAIIVLMLMLMMGSKILAKTNEEIFTVKKDENTYLIYIKNVLNSNFEFAFSKENDGTNLNYISSIKDTQGNNIAYVDATLKGSYFNSDSTYLWIKNNNQVIGEGILINLEDSKTEVQLQSIQDFTKRITVNSSAEEDKIKINGNDSETYYYEMYSVASSEDYQRLIKLFEEVSKYTDETDTYTKLKAYDELYDLYHKLLNTVNQSNWIEVTNLEIEKPYDAKENQKYILWLKNEDGQVDFQILTAYQKEVTTTQEKAVTVEAKSKLPITYDATIVLCIVLAIVVVAIFVMLLVRKKLSNQNKRK
jgi:hypothetical protein